MQKNPMVYTDLDSYQSFFDHDWAKKINELADGTPLDPLVFNLAFAWKGAANTHMMPWLLVELVGQFADGFVNSHEPPSAKLISALTKKLDKELDGEIRPMMRKKIVSAMTRINGDLNDALESNPYKFNRNDCWRFYLQQSEFVLSLVASQRLCYAGLYFGYEDFLVNCYKLLTTVDHYQTGRSTVADFESTFGPTITKSCWTDDLVKTARLVRNDLVHNGGRVGHRLERLNHGLTVIDGELQIMACDTSALYDELKVRSMQLAECTQELIALKQRP